jgi:hypothetical protein
MFTDGSAFSELDRCSRPISKPEEITNTPSKEIFTMFLHVYCWKP